MKPKRYCIDISPAAYRQLRKLSGDVRDRVAVCIDGLVSNPLPAGAKKLEAATGLYRIKTGDYRIIYRIVFDQLIVVVIKVAHRREAYRRIGHD